jgi:hypothetical protein
MPTLLTVKGIRFFFYSKENDEPPHIHFEKVKRSEKPGWIRLRSCIGSILNLLKKE